MRTIPLLVIALIGNAFIFLTSHIHAQDPKYKANADTTVLNDSTQAYLYYALADVRKASNDTIFLEDNVYFFINKANGTLNFKRPGQPVFPVPPEYYNNLSEFMFQFLADDAFGILKRMKSMPGLLQNSKIGIDVASHQSATKAIEWDKVKQDTLYAPTEFVFIRSTMGYSVNYDPKFVTHYNNASAKGFQIGFYHNFVMNKDKRADYKAHAEEQARKFVESFNNRNVQFKPVLDIETHEKFAVVEGHFTPEQVREATKAFIDIVEKELKTDIIIYTYEAFYNKYLKGHFDDKYYWIARYPQREDFDKVKNYPGSRNPFMGISYDFKTKTFNTSLKTRTIGWQFSATGSVEGIHNDVDLNIFPNTHFDKWLMRKQL
jgi:GH25 family lysozyme M1 (1,4-beta-N-acetylmuramidase)